MQALLLVWTFWCALIPQERVGFQVTAPGSLSRQVNSNSPDSGTDVHPAPETSTGTAAASPVAKLPSALLKISVTNVPEISAMRFAAFSGYTCTSPK